MSSSRSNLRLRQVTIQDVEDLYKMLVQSFEGQETLSLSSLRDDLFPRAQVIKPDITSSDASIELDLGLFELQRPLTQAIVAELDDHLVGYALFHYYYTPWVGHGMFIDDIFVRKCVKDIGATQVSIEAEAIHLLLQKVTEIARNDNLKMVLFSESKLSTTICSGSEQEFGYIRGPQTDWSVLRIHLDKE